MTAMSVCETILLLFQRDTTSKEHDAEAISQTTNDVVLTLNLSAFSSSAVFICIARSPHYEKIQELSRTNSQTKGFSFFSCHRCNRFKLCCKQSSTFALSTPSFQGKWVSVDQRIPHFNLCRSTGTVYRKLPKTMRRTVRHGIYGSTSRTT
eukprot:m.218683 g.218683  ORF g.218683 m.218683 type:complete len:151 (+) comp39903_c1_seq1:598-1050(+)